MLPLKDYPHVPSWFTLDQVVTVMREAAIKFAGSFELRPVLVFEEKNQLLGILTLQDIVQGLEGEIGRGAWPGLMFLAGSCGSRIN
jgi:hypothetical protein